MTRFFRFARRLVCDDSGNGAIEYALIAALVGVVIITGLNEVSSAVNTTLGDVADKINPSD